MFRQRVCAVKCDVCKGVIEETFLGKLRGGFVKDAKGKKHAVCSVCQEKFRSKDALLAQLA